MKNYINAKQLRRLQACDRQVELFVQTFGEGNIEISLENGMKAADAGLNISWAADHIFSKTKNEMYWFAFHFANQNILQKEFTKKYLKWLEGKITKEEYNKINDEHTQQINRLKAKLFVEAYWVK